MTRNLLQLFSAILVSLTISAAPISTFCQSSSLRPEHLTCEYLVSPLGIDAQRPRFGWELAGEGRNLHQSAYEIIVADNASDASDGTGNVWSSGKLASAEQNQIEYGGKRLEPFTRYFWRVRVFDAADEPSAWSPTAWFETAMLQATDWTSKWISDGSANPSRDEEYYKSDPMPLFRKTFMAGRRVQSARLYITGLGYYEAFINGERVGDRVLDPGWTTYRKQVLYSVYDITSMINNGDNVIAVTLGNGWWNPLPFKLFGRWDLRDYQQTGRPCLRAEIHLRYDDSTTDIIATDNSWLTRRGPVVRNNVYLGEHYDARLEIAGWNTLRQKTDSWTNSTEVEGPQGVLTVQMQPPIRVTTELHPVSVREHKPGVFIADFGQNFAGVIQIRVKGPAGTKINFRYGEGLFDDGSLNVMTTVATQIKKGGIRGGPGAPETAWQEDSYTLKGKGLETWSPRFTFHGFRYVEITGWPGKPTIDDIEGLRMNSDLEPNGKFLCSNEFLNQLHGVVQWTFLSNVFSVQSDCPGREKMGYGADIAVTANAFMYNYNMTHFYGKTLHDYRNEQRPLGGMTEIAPFTGIADRGYGDLSGPLGWQLVFPYLQEQMYQFYGDKRIVDANYEPLQKQIEFLKSQAKYNLFFWDISDHEALDPKPEGLTASAFYYAHLRLAARFAGLLGKKDDSIAYTTLSQQVRRAIVRQYHIPGTGRFDNGTQSAQLFALWYDLTPEKAESLNAFLSELKRHHGHLSTGIFSTKMFFDVMRENDLGETAYQVVNVKDFPGWRYMLENGATTLWETWAFPETGPSRNHPMFGSVDEWFYRSLLGINPGAPGFSHVIIKPQPAGDLAWAKGSYRSIRGEIESSWVRKGDTFTLNVMIPANVTAQIWVPSKPDAPVRDGDNLISSIRYDGGYAVVEVGSGQYSFQSTTD